MINNSDSKAELFLRKWDHIWLCIINNYIRTRESVATYHYQLQHMSVCRYDAVRDSPETSKIKSTQIERIRRK